MITLQLTQAQVDVLFHVVNNSFGLSFERAVERAAECDGMSREDFINVFVRLANTLSNAG